MHLTPALDAYEDVEYQLKIAYGDKYGELTNIISRDDNPDLILVHVSENSNLGKFIPRFSTRTYPGETTAIPRISTSPTVMQAMVGRGDPEVENQTLNKNSRIMESYSIYTLLWNHAVKPDKKLVPDVGYTDEHWVIAATPEERVYEAIKLGTFFFSESTAVPVVNGNIREYAFYFKISEPCYLIPGFLAKRGFYKVVVDGWTNPTTIFALDKNTTVEQVPEGEYILKYNRRFKTRKKTIKPPGF